ncbi:MAG: TonB-dependent receptor [Bacteroidales bacterium]|jgi:TonB-linked SusC/RagA family outer membrane protein|nr:TonB-dependent receptor [Bacteroidales bacterium]
MYDNILRKTNPVSKKIGLFLILILGFTGFSMAQVRTIKGVVTASDTKETLPGATIVIKGTTTGSVTDIDGKYSISIKTDKVILVFSYVGYNTKEIDPGNQTVVDVQLEPKKTTLDEVVVIGYGSVRKSDLSGSVGSVKAEDITRITALNPVQSLQGNVTGVQVASTSGTPGEKPAVRIRGVGTFGNSNPIYVVDGVIVDDISFLNSNDITSMEVLKDASASAIYGSRGANGVIMVTTKMGKGTDGKTAFSFSGEVGMQKLAKKIGLLNGRDFAIISNEIKPGSYNNVDAVPNTDWQDLVFHTAPVYDFQLSASGASKNIQYYISGGYFKQGGIIDKSSYQRITLKINNIYNLSKFVELGNNITIAPYSQQIAPDVTYAVYRAKPTLVPYYPDGSFAAVPGVGNPLADLAYSNNFNKGVRGVGNIFGEVNFLKAFTFKSSFGIDAAYNKSENFTPAFTVYNPDGSISQQQNLMSRLSKNTNYNFTWLWENTLNFKKEFGKHSIDAVAGYTMQNTTSDGFDLLGKNLIRDASSFWYIQPAYIYDPANNVNTINNILEQVDNNLYYSMISFLFRVNYVFNKRYILTATFRSDGSSKFAQNNRYANFPSFALGWNVSQEKFMQNIKWLNKLKLRGSWGKLGNDKIPYWDRYARVESNILAIFGINNDPNTGASYGINGNPNLKWEVTTQTDVGLEFGLFDSRLTAEFDYYNKKTNDILVLLSTPGYLGNGAGAKVRFNAASVVNRGFEFNLGWRDQVGKFKYYVGVLGTTIHNEVLSIGGNSGVDSVLIGGYLGNGVPVTQSQVGLPIGAFYGYQTDGVFQSQAELNAYPHNSQAGVGDLRFVDVNGDGKIDGLDRTYIGNPIPKFIFGFNFGFEIYGLDFSVNVQGQTGNKIFNGKEVVRPDPYNFESHVLNRWTGPGTSNTEPRPSFGGYNYTPSDHFIQDGSFLRIRNLVLGYTLPTSWSTKIYMQKFRIYVKADNLYTLTKYTGYTPEIGSSDVLSAGIDNGIYPITAVYSIGINLNF